ncbi:MAG: hypothetical protein GXP14_15735 [Gammaproteobacteria bacterium]|nr:hypothetical protein [Gammaproteobacteria bacterium]
MTLVQTILSVILAVTLVAWILFVLFGQITVRRLRKNPETKDSLGINLASGWDILNVAQALTLPKDITRRINNNFGGFEADPDLLYKHTTVLDRILARIFYVLFFGSAFSMLILIVMNGLGVLD